MISNLMDLLDQLAELGRQVIEEQTADPGNFGEEQGPAVGKSPAAAGDDVINFTMGVQQ